MRADGNSDRAAQVPPMRRRLGSADWRVSLSAVVLLACCGVGVSQAAPAVSLVNKKAPEFVRRQLNGRKIDLATLRGKVVLLNFWATWCAPCQVEMPVFAGWQSRYGAQGFEAVGISMDDDSAPPRRLTAKLKLNYPVIMGDEKLGELYGGVLGLPVSYLVDRDGVVRAQFKGEADLNTIEAEVRKLLSQP